MSLTVSVQAHQVRVEAAIQPLVGDLAARDIAAARDITDELARGIVAFSESLDALEDADGAEGSLSAEADAGLPLQRAKVIRRRVRARPRAHAHDVEQRRQRLGARLGLAGGDPWLTISPSPRRAARNANPSGAQNANVPLSGLSIRSPVESS